MGLDIENVHILKRKKGTNQLDTVGVNPYARLISEGEFPVNVQKGRFYTDGGDRIMLEDLKPWVKPALMIMSSKGRLDIGLEDGWDGVDPPSEEVQTLKEPEVDPGPREMKKSIVDWVYELNHDDDEHWTKEGKPNLSVLAILMGGVYTSRKAVDEATQNYRRTEKETTDGNG